MAEEILVLAAVLKSIGEPRPVSEVRLMALLAMHPRLLTPLLTADEAAIWQRLIGAEAAPLPSGITELKPAAEYAWGKAILLLRETGRLIEDLSSQTWAPGENLDAFCSGEGWPDGPVSMISAVLRRQGADELVRQLPESFRRWINAKAA